MYTHYWTRDIRMSGTEFSTIGNDVKRVLSVIEEDGVALRDTNGTGIPEVSDDVIAFNGSGDGACEGFWFPRVGTHLAAIERRPKGLWWNFCKTSRYPYDIAVAATLVVAKLHLGEAISVKCDGGEAGYALAKKLVLRVLGRSVARVTDAEADEE